ncbi:acyl carrier protein [Erythrobacter sp. HKB08]|uniref:acyl carrier protein n=1 Tax=Erythrobacter sp. HKB08 TaxID=2502843 RepID=UPI0010092958|nr:acyl carrier protein [Erythrobacter sp. HKB08]
MAGETETSIEKKGLAPSRQQIDDTLRSILADVLGLDADRVEEFDADTGLFGHLPELDSMAVAGLLTEIEDRLHIIIEDEDVDAEMIETYGGLLAFAEMKVVAA